MSGIHTVLLEAMKLGPQSKVGSEYEEVADHRKPIIPTHKSLKIVLTCHYIPSYQLASQIIAAMLLKCTSTSAFW